MKSKPGKTYGRRLRITPEEEDLILEYRANAFTNLNTNENTALEEHLKKRKHENI